MWWRGGDDQRFTSRKNIGLPAHCIKPDLTGSIKTLTSTDVCQSEVGPNANLACSLGASLWSSAVALFAAVTLLFPAAAQAEAVVAAEAQLSIVPVPNGDPAHKVVSDSESNTIVVDTFAGAWSCDVLITKSSSAGVPLWTNRYNEPPNSDDQATA